jgi:hypothetical protein
MLRLRAVEDRLGDLGGEEGERKEPTDVALVQAVFGGKVALTRSITAQYPIEPASSPDNARNKCRELMSRGFVALNPESKLSSDTGNHSGQLKFDLPIGASVPFKAEGLPQASPADPDIHALII